MEPLFQMLSVRLVRNRPTMHVGPPFFAVARKPGTQVPGVPGYPENTGYPPRPPRYPGTRVPGYPGYRVPGYSEALPRNSYPGISTDVMK
eukprot:1928369-Rhodomonas_salina.1